jgi:hypothetical protein
MRNYGNVTIVNSKTLMGLIVIQKVKPMTRGRVNPAWTNKSRRFRLTEEQSQNWTRVRKCMKVTFRETSQNDPHKFVKDYLPILSDFAKSYPPSFANSIDFCSDTVVTHVLPHPDTSCQHLIPRYWQLWLPLTCFSSDRWTARELLFASLSTTSLFFCSPPSQNHNVSSQSLNFLSPQNPIR